MPGEALYDFFGRKEWMSRQSKNRRAMKYYDRIRWRIEGEESTVNIFYRIEDNRIMWVFFLGCDVVIGKREKILERDGRTGN
jgi:hypothetical protein